MTISIDLVIEISILISILIALLITVSIKRKSNLPSFKWNNTTIKDTHILNLKADKKAIFTEIFTENPVKDNISSLRGYFDWQGAVIEQIELFSDKASSIHLLDSDGTKMNICEGNKLIINQQVTKAYYLIEYPEYLNKHEPQNVTVCVTMDNKDSKMIPELYVEVKRPIKNLELILDVEQSNSVKNVKKQIFLNIGDTVKPSFDKPIKNIIKEIRNGIETKKYIYKIRHPKLLCTYKIVWEYVEDRNKVVLIGYNENTVA